MQAELETLNSPISQPLTVYQNVFTLGSRFWLKWFFTVSFLLVIYASIVPIAPYLHMDEFMIVDLGRVILHPESKWSITWMTESEQPVFVIFYIGPVLQEFAFGALGEFGPRIIGIIAAILSATLVVKWLLLKGTLPNVAFLLGLVFLLDPLFVQSYTMGRVDGWTIASCVAACICLKSIRIHFLLEMEGKVLVCLAGFFMALSFMIWPSAVFLFPLILSELYLLMVKCQTENKSWRKSGVVLALFAGSAALSLILLLLPILPQLLAQMDNIIAGFKVNTQSGSGAIKSNYERWILPVVDLLRNLKYTPILFAVALIALVRKRNLELLLALSVATILMLGTVVYIHRVLYLLPYFIVCVAGLHCINGAHKVVGWFNRLSLSLLVFWAVFLSVIVRFGMAEYKPAERDRNLLYKAGDSMIGKGNYTVLTPFEFYYTGRALGWKMYAPYLSVGQSFTSNELNKILPHVQYAILEKWRLTPEFTKTLAEQGMQDKGWYKVYNEYVEKFDGITTNTTRMRNLYSIHRHPYGPYKLFVKN